MIGVLALEENGFLIVFEVYFQSYYIMHAFQIYNIESQICKIGRSQAFNKGKHDRV